jgi:hypothetical protein
MTILGIVAIIAVVVLGLIVLRVKSDPMEKESVRKILSDAKPAAEPGSTGSRPPTKSDR